MLLTIQLLGQVVLEFQLSIAQLLLALGSAATVELVVTGVRTRTIGWPASALLTGNGVALILRVPGTEHGDWWSLRGGWIFAATAAFGVASKYVVRVGDRPLFNPNNLALVVCFLVLGSGRVEPLDFWWGPLDPDVLVAIAVILGGAVVILRRLRLGTIALTFSVTFAASIAVVALAGHCLTARWHVGELCGFEFWRVLVTSPEVLIFACFMITDPRTVPTGRRAQVVFAIGIGVLAGVLLAPQSTEFGAKVALLGSLTIACALRPLIERAFAVRRPQTLTRRVMHGGIVTVVAIVALVLAGAPARPHTRPAIATDVEFPLIADDAVPSWSVADDRLSRQVPDADAAQIARDLVEDLALQTQALCARDLPLAAASADLDWLDDLETTMEANARARTRIVPEYDIDSIVVSVALRIGQEAPAVLATVNGTVRQLRFGERCDAPVSVGEPEMFVTTWEVLWNGDRFLITSDELPESFTPPTAP